MRLPIVPLRRPLERLAALPSGCAAARGWRGVLLAVTSALALAGCGGGTLATPFVPTRGLAFGDETSVIDTAGRKYTVNAVNATGAIDCTGNPIWVQVLITGRYGLTFPQCNPAGTANLPSRILAQPGARVADVAAQVDAFVAAGGFRQGDLVTVMAGANDVRDAFARYPASDVPTLIAQVSAAGRLLGTQINRMADAGAKVVVSTVIDQTFTPVARAQPNATLVVTCPRTQGESEQLALMTCLVDRFNAAMRTTIYNDGTRIGLVLGDVLVRTYLQTPALGGFLNTTTAACAIALPDCTSATFGPADGAGNLPSATTWMWADGLQPSPGLHTVLGNAAVSRALANPF